MTNGKRQVGFKLSPGIAPAVNSPEELFYSLQRTIPHPWSQQADVWRNYAEHHEANTDVALELSTGSGKTLIGLVIGEYRRRKFSERVLYLCPTRQLVHQVGDHAAEYGIEAVVCLAQEYNGFTKYLSAKAIAITTYSSLFNISPHFENPETIILDDVHGAENYIADMWSLVIERAADKQLYYDLMGLFRDEIGDAAHFILDEEWKDRDNLTYALAQPYLLEKKDALIDLLNANSTDKKWRFAWSILNSNLHACQLYYSADEVLIRPFIPPTKTHLPFASAKQRIYMSATLGSGGELERMTGVPTITKVPPPNRRENSGRRLFLFPDSQLSVEQTSDLMVQAIQESGKALVLTPTNADAQKYGSFLSKNQIRVMGSDDIANSMSSFGESKDTALVLSNRYDGIDLAHDACRLLVFAGRPAGTNLQEWFLLTRLNTSQLLLDRIRTRFIQGIGRCCRSETDYCAVIVVGQQLYEFCSRTDFVQPMSPDLQSEIQFGLTNSESEGTLPEDLLSLIKLMLSKTQQWKDADEAIRNSAKSFTQKSDPKAVLLSQIAQKEVKFIYQLWKKELTEAINTAVEVADCLNDCKEADAYRSWWLYLAGCASVMNADVVGSSEQREKAKQLFKSASSCSNNSSWFSEIVLRLTKSTPATQEEELSLDVQKQCELALDELTSLGFTGSKFDKYVNALSKKLTSKDYKLFETGVTELGRLLGFKTDRPNKQGTPDSIWWLSSRLVFAFECKSEVIPENPISHQATREAACHISWMKSNRRVEEPAIRTIMITPQTTIAKDAHNIAIDHRELFYIPYSSMLPLADRVVQSLRNVRGSMRSQDNLAIQKAINKEFASSKLLIDDIAKEFTYTLLADLPIAGIEDS